jgi:hypothetical protein
MPDAHKRLKTALDETRLLILGAQVLFGFHLNAVFQSEFDSLPETPRLLYALAFLAMASSIALLIAPSMQHRLVEEGRTSGRLLGLATWLAGLALLPFALSLAIDLSIVLGFRFGNIYGTIVGIFFGFLALFWWYGLEWIVAMRRGGPAPKASMSIEEQDTPTDVRVEHMLTEARVLLPGAQALFGFQLAVLLTSAFGSLPQASKVVHAAALCCLALAVILLMAPAAFHRISYGGQNTEGFLRLGSGLIIASAVPLAAAIGGDLYVSITKALGDPVVGIAAALVAIFMLAGLWFVHPLLVRARRRRLPGTREEAHGLKR